MLIGVFIFWRTVIDGGNAGPPTPGAEQTVTDPQYFRADGYINYIRVSDDMRRQGVTSDENAFVDFMRAIGPGGNSNGSPSDHWKLVWESVSDGEPLPTGPFFDEIHALNTLRKLILVLRPGHPQIRERALSGLRKTWGR